MEVKYTGEPYVMAADVYTATPHEGHAGWTWYTGASGWMYRAGIEWILGLRRKGTRLYIDPCIPKNWPSFSVNYYVGKTCYSILVKNKLNNTNGKYLTINGNQQSISEETPYIILDDDGYNHQIELQL
ncbi:hypothetical protein KHA80_00525 [Anaerobacillus sp. HL2]|nr:hypothetical protein KHA80_00525 [Anaerobacillus sp. HL2]